MSHTAPTSVSTHPLHAPGSPASKLVCPTSCRSKPSTPSAPDRTRPAKSKPTQDSSQTLQHQSEQCPHQTATVPPDRDLEQSPRTNGAGPVSSYIVETLDVTNPGNTWAPATTGPRHLASTATPQRQLSTSVNGRTYLVRVEGCRTPHRELRLHRRSGQSRGFASHTSSARGYHRP